MDIQNSKVIQSYVLHEISQPFLAKLKALEIELMHDLDLYQQFTIDYIQEWDDDFGDEYQNLEWDDAGSAAYYADTLMEVMKDGADKKAVSAFHKIYEQWAKALDSMIPEMRNPNFEY